MGSAARRRFGVALAVLSGGCLQNRLLRTNVANALGARGHRGATAREIPCNDGGISAGQAYVAALAESERR
jgi:hydrogenase maturation protein HypF